MAGADVAAVAVLVGDPWRLYAELLRLRRELPRAVEARADDQVVTVRRGDVELVLDFTHRTLELGR